MFHRECVTDTKHSSEKQLARLVTIYTNMTSQLLTQNREVQQRWVYFSGSLYQVSSTKKTWNQSRSDCFQKGADLLIINSKEEQVSQFTRAGPNIHQRGSWKWVDGTLLEFKGAERGKGENCGDIKNFNAEKSWNDESCSLSLLWIYHHKEWLWVLKWNNHQPPPLHG
uniref:C-type lectin domain-containing protein n=1 Tax=Takifugu rubripes TaxID=31033 RepID=A0A3B5KGS3_TAKRU